MNARRWLWLGLAGVLTGCSGGLEAGVQEPPGEQVEVSSVLWSNMGYKAGWSRQYSQPDNPSTGFYAVQQIGTSASPGSPTHGNSPTSLRMEVRSNEKKDGGGRFHSELHQDGLGGLGQTRYYGFATYFPSAGAVEGATFFQLFNPAGQNKPMVMFFVNSSGQVTFKVIKNIADDSDDVLVTLGNPGYGSFKTFVVGVKWSTGADGWIKVWMNNSNESSPTKTYSGVTCNSDCNSSLSVRMQMGVYMPRWTNIGLPPSPEKRWIYHDTIRVATSFSEAKP